MGYPTEIPNAMPSRGEPPTRSLLARAFDRTIGKLIAALRRRPRRRDDAPACYGQGVDPRLPSLKSRDKIRLDFDEITRKT